MITKDKQYKKYNIKAEVILAEMIEKNEELSIDSIIIQPDGGFNHTNRREISIIGHNQGQSQAERYLVKVAKKGIYDILPEGITHIKKAKNKDETNRTLVLIKEIKRKKEEEKAARKFFAPFDQNFNRYRLLIEMEERRLLVGFPTGTKHTFYDMIWNDNHHFLSNYQKSTLFSILPLAHEISSDIDLIVLAYKSIFNLGITGSLVWTKNNYADSSADQNNTTLGVDMILGNQFESVVPCYHISIGPISIEESYGFLPNHKHHETLQLLEDFLVPMDMEVKYNFIHNSKPILFGKSELGPENRLGYTIHL